MQHDVIIACDFKSAEDTFRFLDLFKDEERKPFLKIGMELFYAEGPAIVREIKRRGHRIFLDLKLHDIPNTVKKAMAVLSRLDVDMCNVHAAGTIEMMRAAREGLTREDGTRPLLIAVTQLTSTSEERMQQELLIASSIGDTIVKYAQNTKAAGLDDGFDVLRFCGSQCGYTGVLGEQVLDHDIHAGIRTLRGQPDTDKQLPCMGVVQGASGIRILFLQTVNDLQCQSLPGGKILRHFLANRHCSNSFDKKLR